MPVPPRFRCGTGGVSLPPPAKSPLPLIPEQRGGANDRDRTGPAHRHIWFQHRAGSYLRSVDTPCTAGNFSKLPALSIHEHLRIFEAD